ncbi:6-phosphogluconolactonase [Streptosporangium roseum]|uniref:6-phosphogluconolactonase n=1 Tax=Streptosporangium roseum (strain ATCC 12428 / DSM 43021 / JCM 3005 / KCTC 9067 / NCIMB 10171 / NRRL 2505 / NI 9100) TaxID=479432 RepID=D2AVA1_STRRD|nr:6-phosphogluconolactonase [Streptosporangium roseum]ACZ88752.1 6-phosphogluconolactonase [Streptosporangium roseum DSM 43021]
MSVPNVIIHRDADMLAKAVAARVITRTVDVQSGKGSASLVLTGGTVGIATLAEIAASPARDAIDWRNLDIWWGDERFLPSGHPERNETGARQALLDHVDVDPARVHVMRGPDSGMTAEESAEAYADELRRAARPEDHGPAPSFDVMMLGMGPDGHVASLFPGMPALYETRPVVAVHGSPKPPPTRISLTLPVIQGSREVWLIAAGEEKAGAVRLALSDSGPMQVPAAGARGRRQTLFLLDRAAASKIPSSLGRLSSP